MSFNSILHKTSHSHKELVQGHVNEDKHKSVATITGGKRDKRGCEFCPLNTVKGIHKVKGEVKGKNIFIWAQSPGPQENRKREELIGLPGKFLWYELKRVGIKRKHCDIQNVVRCMPADVNENQWPPFKMRAPNKQEVKCCSIYNDEAIAKSKAKLHLVFGQVAAAAVLRKEFKKDQRIFYSDILKAWVVYFDHPSYFIRQGYSAGDGKPANASLTRFRADLDKSKQLLKKDNFDRYAYLKEQKYIGVTRTEQSNKVYKLLKNKAKQGYRLIADMEEGRVNDRGEPDDKGKSVALCCGFSYRPGTTYVFSLKHPNTGISKSCYEANRRNVQRLFTSEGIKKGFHYGISDTNAVRRLLGVTVLGYDYDTLLSSYFKDPNAKKYGLAAIAEQHYPDFLDYKSIEGPDGFTLEYRKLLETPKYAKLSLPQQVTLARTKNYLNLARLPWKKMVLYNGADCDLEKRIELDTKKYVNQALMQVYIDAGYILHRMETDKRCLPLFDYRWHHKVEKLFERRERKLEKQIRKMAGKYAYIPKKNKAGEILEIVKKEFIPTSNAHILWLLYDKLKYKYKGEDKNDKPNTRAKTLMRLGLKHKKANIIVEYRQTVKAKGTYVDGYLKCAKKNKGHLRTNWKMTTTATGRLSSGKTKDKKNDAVINFQNIHGDELIKCLLISDRRYRELYEYWLKYGKFDRHTWKKFENLYVDLGYDFSQNELRQLAEESGDKNLIKMFSGGKDPHVEVGHALTGWSKESIAKDDHVRKLVKNMQFGLVYGLQGEGLFNFIEALGVKTSLEEVNKYHRKYFRKFPGVKRLQDHYHKFAEKHGYVINVFGFRRKLNVSDQREMDEFGDERGGAYWKNQAINTPIQGAAHQLLMMAIAAIFRYPKKYHLLQFPNKEIHDALYFRVKLKYLFAAVKQGLKLMLDEPVKIVEEDFGLKKKVPLAAKPKAGLRFGVNVDIDNLIRNEHEFLNSWCRANKKLEHSYRLQMKALETRNV